MEKLQFVHGVNGDRSETTAKIIKGWHYSAFYWHSGDVIVSNFLSLLRQMAANDTDIITL